MFNRILPFLLSCLVFSSSLLAQGRSNVFSILSFKLNPKYLFDGDLRMYQVQIVDSTDQGPIAFEPIQLLDQTDSKQGVVSIKHGRIVRSDSNGVIRITLLTGNTYTLELQHRDSSSMGPERGQELLHYSLTLPNPEEITVRIPEDIPVRLDRFIYDRWNEFHDDTWVRTRTPQIPIGYGEPFSNGHPALVEYLKSPAERIMSLPRKLAFAKNARSIAVFPDIPYDQSQEPLMLGLLVNDTGADLVTPAAMITLQAQDEQGEWQPIEGPDYIVHDLITAPIIFPAHSCRNFPIRRYSGPFKTRLRVVFTGSDGKDPFLISEPFEGSVFPSQIKQAKKIWAETRHW